MGWNINKKGIQLLVSVVLIALALFGSKVLLSIFINTNDSKIEVPEKKVGVEIKGTLPTEQDIRDATVVIVGDRSPILNVGDVFDVDSHFIARDLDGSNMKIEVIGSYDMEVEGVYKLTLLATDSNGDTSKAVILLTVQGELHV